MDNRATIERFYRAFAARDAAGMIECYHPDVRFSDPVFVDLRGRRAGAMWRMLAGRSKDLAVVASAIRADDRTGSAHWQARYTFSATGRRVVNEVDAWFELEGGKIIRHEDTFDLWRWARMALGPKGVLLGWLPPVQAAIRKNAMTQLEAFLAAESK
jgi:ketosteroid isomerase-like protein